MSSLFTQISQEAAKQLQQIQQSHPREKGDDTVDTTDHSLTRAVENASDKTTDDVNPSSDPNGRTEQPNGHTERKEQIKVSTDDHIGDAEQSSAKSPEEPTSLIEEMRHGVDDTSRPTERYSFEIYTDQKDKILEVAYRYQKRTGKRLPKSRIIREALDQYLNQILEQA